MSRLLTSAHEELLACQQALKEFVISADTVYGKEQEEFFVGFEGSFGSKHLTPRSLSARHIGNLVCVEGIVTKCKLKSNYDMNFNVAIDASWGCSNKCNFDTCCDDGTE